MKEKVHQPGLFKLYLSFHLNKIFCFLLVFILILWVAILLLNANFPFPKEEYLKDSVSFHQYYYDQSIFFMQIINGVVVAFLVGAEISTVNQFDPMFVSVVPRPRIVIAKLLSNLFILTALVCYEVVLLHVVGTLVFPNYIFDWQLLVLIPFVLLPLVELLLLGEFITTILFSYFIPILIFLLHITLLIFMQSTEVDWISMYIPQIYFENIVEAQLSWNAFLYTGICGLFTMAIFLSFQKKDISL